MTAELLPPNLAQTAHNVVLHNGGVRSLFSPVQVAAPTKPGVKKTIFRFGRRQPEDKYWFTWTTPVNVVNGPIAGDVSERTYFTGDGRPKKTDFSLALQGGTDYPFAAYDLGVPAPKSAPSVENVVGKGPEVVETRAYVYTNVTAWGEESGPSPAALGEAKATHVCKLTLTDPLPSGAYAINARRIYRSVTSSAGTNYYYVAQLPAGTLEFVDSLDIASVGEPLPSLDWDMPPDALAGLIALPSGALCGFTGKQVCFSVIGAPYAWPQKYRLTCDYEIVAVAAMGQGVVVLTEGYPYLINTGDPEGAMMIRLDEEQSCVSARSVASYQGGVLFASPDGLVLVNSEGSEIVTRALFDNRTWRARGPENIFAVKHDGRYYGFWKEGGFVFDASGNFTTHSITSTAAYVDPVLDQLYLTDADGLTIRKWDSGAALTHEYRTKRMNLPAPANFSCAQVKANTFADLRFRVFGDGILVHEEAVTSPEPFRLPGGFRSRLYEFEIAGTDHWTAFALAASMQELKREF